MSERRSPSHVPRLRGLIDVTRLVRSGADLPTLLDAVARTVAESLGFALVVVDLYRPAWDDLEVAAVHGTEAQRTSLLGQTRGVADVEPLLAARFERRGAALLVPLLSTEGALLGTLAVDAPVSRQPLSDEEVEVLLAVCEHAALAIESAQESARAERHRLGLEHLLAVSASLTETRPVAEVLATVCDAVHAALGFGTVSVDLLDPATDHYVSLASIGAEDAGPPFSRAELEGLLADATEVEGCYLFEDAEARARLSVPDRPTHTSLLNGRGPHAWDRHWLVVPLVGRSETTSGFVWVDDPGNRLLPNLRVLQTLRAFANHAAAALDTAAHVDALVATNSRHQMLIDSSPLAIIDVDADGVVHSWNAAAERIFGWTAAEAIGAVAPWVPDELREQFRHHCEIVIGGRSLEGVEVERRRKDGRPITVAIWTAPVRDDDGRIVRAMSIVRDVTERRQAEQALVASEARTAAILESALDAVITLDHEGRVVEFNRAAEETFGMTRGEALGRDFLALAIPPRFRDGVAATLHAGSGPLLGSRLEIEAVRSDGREFTAEIVLSRVQVEGPALYTACLRDITRQKRSQEELRETAAKYRSLVEGLPLATYVNELGLPVRTRWMSPQIEQMLGFAADEWLADGFFEARIHPHDRARILAEVERTHAGAQPFRQEYRLVAKDGSVVWVLDETIAVRDDEYRPLFLQGFLIDVTDRRASEEALRQSERLYRLVIENATDAIALLDLEGVVLYASPAAERLLDAAPGGLVGRSHVDFLHPDDVERGSSLLASALAAATPLPAASRLRAADGTWLPVEGVVSAIRDDDGSPAGLLTIVRAAPARDRLRLAG